MNEVTAALRMIHGVDRQDVLGSRCSDPGPRLILGLVRSGRTVRINNGGTFKATASGNRGFEANCAQCGKPLPARSQ